MGCRESRKTECSHSRSAEYYSTPSGKEKKRDLNGRRSTKGADAISPTRPLRAASDLLRYVHLIARQLGLDLHDEQVRARVERAVRQHSLPCPLAMGEKGNGRSGPCRRPP